MRLRTLFLAMCFTAACLPLAVGLEAAGAPVAGKGAPPAWGVQAKGERGPLEGRPPRAAEPEEKVSLPEAASQDWWSQVQEAIRKDEYTFTWQEAAPAGGSTSGKSQEAGWGAFNHAQGFSMRFSDRGFSVSPAKEGASWEWGLSLAAWGRAGALHPAEKAALHADKNRLDASRPGLDEWFLNDERGLEQGFTIPAPPADPNPAGSTGRVDSSAPPAGERPPVPGRTGATVDNKRTLSTLHIALSLTGNLRPVISEDGQAVDFYDDGSVNVVRYAQLKVTDATGKKLPAHFEGWTGVLLPNSEFRIPNFSGGIRIAVDDAGAVYPITVDPIATSPSWYATGQNTGDAFGYSASTAGDVNGDGYSDVLVSAPGFNSHQGKVYLYLGGPSGLSSANAWSALGEGSDQEFGDVSVTAGDVNGDGFSDVIIVADAYDNFRGKAYLYLGGATGLSTGYSWSAVGEHQWDYFGSSAATAGDVNGDGYSDVVIGAWDYSASITDQGKAYVFQGGSWGLSSAWSWAVAGQNAHDFFGHSVATAGDVNGDGYSDVIIGISGYSSGCGRAQVYLGGPGGLSTTVSWSTTGAAGDGLGISVSTAGDVDGNGYADVIVGAHGYNGNQGRAQVFLGGASGLASTSVWSATGENPNDEFGMRVGTAGDVNGDGYADVIVGAVGFNSQQGKAYLFLGRPTGVFLSLWSATGENSGDLFGVALGTAGDVNGDGYSDLIVGAYHYLGGTGKAYVYLGGTAWVTSGATLWADPPVPGAFGWSVAGAGDVNGDGFDDVIIGAPATTSNTGRAYLYLGGSSGFADSAAWYAAGENAGDSFGGSVAGAGDVNGDGYADVIVGAYGNNGLTGKAYLFLGGPSGLATTASWTAAGEAAGSEFGLSVASAGDVNGDGYSDVIIGAPNYGSNAGRAYIYLGKPTGLSAVRYWYGQWGSDLHLGTCVAGAGDVNGDGYSDVIVGGPGTGSAYGWAYIFLGGPSGMTYSWFAGGPSPASLFGTSVAGAGDVNRDGYSDVIVGAPGSSTAWVYVGRPSGLPTCVGGLSGAAGTNFGGSVSTAGDLNGDGYSDLIIGAPQTSSGMACIYSSGPSGFSGAFTLSGPAGLGCSVASAGNVNGDGYSDVIMGAYGVDSGAGEVTGCLGGTGVPVMPGQVRSDLSGRICPLGLAIENQFRIALKLRSPFGMALVRMEWQVAPLGGSFNPILNPIQGDTAWWSSGLSGYSRQALVTLPDQAGPFIWRARAAYGLARTPFQGHGPWYSLPSKGLYETALRGAPEVTCVLPDEPCWLYSLVKSGTDYTLNWQDPNHSNQRTGWNIRRSNNASLPKGSWPLVGSNVVDMDPVTANYQWTDHSGDDPGPGGVWYYEVTAYNANCPAEGPF